MVELDIIRTHLENALSEYGLVPPRTPLSADHPIVARFRRLRDLIAQSAPIIQRPTLRVTQSTGKGGKSKVPWIALLDSRETKSTRSGVYCVYLFRQDLSGVYLTFNQGATSAESQFYSVSRSTHRSLRSKAEELRPLCDGLEIRGFSLDGLITLKTDSALGLGYEAGTIAYKFYSADAIPTDQVLLDDLDAALRVYDRYLELEIISGRHGVCSSLR
jgi:hypothetical protein